ALDEHHREHVADAPRLVVLEEALRVDRLVDGALIVLGRHGPGGRGNPKLLIAAVVDAGTGSAGREGRGRCEQRNHSADTVSDTNGDAVSHECPHRPRLLFAYCSI